MNRLLSAGEHLLWQIDQAIPQNFVMVGRLSGVPAGFTGILRRALNLVQQRQPTLKCHIKYGPPPSFISGKVPIIPLHVLPRKDHHHWISVTEKEMLVPLPWSHGPLIRVVLLESQEVCDLLVTLCHITADATSGVKFVKQLLHIASLLSQDKVPVPASPFPLLPALPDLLKPEVKQKVEALLASGNPNEPTPRSAEFPGEMDVPPVKRITRVIQRVLLRDDFRRFMIACRRQKVTVHTALCAAVMQVIVAQIRQTGIAPPHGPLTMGCLTPVNIRQHLNQPTDDNMGNFISNAFHFQAIDDAASLWDAARATLLALQQELDKGNDFTGMFRAQEILRPGEEPKDTLARLQDTFPPTAVTNMGQLDIPVHFGDMMLEQLHYSPAMNPVVKNGFALSVCGFQGEMILNFLYAEPYISSKRALHMVEGVMKRLSSTI